MSKVTVGEKLLVTYLVTNCEIYRLKEKNALAYISSNFFRPISRRSYYVYKKKLKHTCSFLRSELQDENILANKAPNFFLLLQLRDYLIKVGEEMGINLPYFDRYYFFTSYFVCSLSHAETALSSSKRFKDQFEKKLRLKDANLKSLPSNVTVRREYVKCGKCISSQCKHGPYYYGYWRDKRGRLIKKYIGVNL
ncbi:MAG: hypothetical protein AB7U98_01450 [Candidatus Nitrosocosmicus sp.]